MSYKENKKEITNPTDKFEITMYIIIVIMMYLCVIMFSAISFIETQYELAVKIILFGSVFVTIVALALKYCLFGGGNK